MADNELRRRWVAALRGGKYDQTRRELRHNRTSANDSFCCLGVLCDVFDPEGWDTINGESYGALLGEGIGSSSHPPPEVMAEAGLSQTEVSTLIFMNDDEEMAFDEIADAVDKERILDYAKTS